MTSDGFKVIIVGAGITGLSLAQALKKAGVAFEVYERDRTRTERLQGFRLSLAAIGSESLQQCLPESLYQAFVATCGKPTQVVRLLSERLKNLVLINKKNDPDSVSVCRSVSRITLRNILLSGLESQIHYDKTFSHYTEEDNQVTVFFKDESSVSGDVLVGADGGNSKVRQQLLPQAQRADTGIRIIGGKVPLTKLTQALLPEAMIGGVTSIMSPKGCGMFIGRQEFQHSSTEYSEWCHTEAPVSETGSLLWDNAQSYVMWALCVRNPRFNVDAMEGSTALLSMAHDICRAWHPDFHSMMDHSEPSTVHKFKIQHALPVPPWKSGRVTLAGDAIHSMPPMGGIGTSIGIQDASLLALQLSQVAFEGNTLEAALNAYQQAMLQYGFAGVRQSLEIAEKFVANGPASPFITKTLLRVLNLVPNVKEKVFATLG